MINTEFTDHMNLKQRTINLLNYIIQQTGTRFGLSFMDPLVHKYVSPNKGKDLNHHQQSPTLSSEWIIHMSMVLLILDMKRLIDFGLAASNHLYHFFIQVFSTLSPTRQCGWSELTSRLSTLVPSCPMSSLLAASTVKRRKIWLTRHTLSSTQPWRLGWTVLMMV